MSIFQPKIVHKRGITSVAFSPNTKLLASGSNDKSVNLYQIGSDSSFLDLLNSDLQSRFEVYEQIKLSHKASVSIVTFSPDGTTFASGSDDGIVRLWKIPITNRKPIQELNHKNWPISTQIKSLCFSPDSNLLASGTTNDGVWMWQLSDGQRVYKLEGHTGPINSVQFSFDGKFLVSGSSDTTVRLWEVSDGSLLCILKGHTSAVRRAIFNSDTSMIFSGGDDGVIRLWGAI